MRIAIVDDLPAERAALKGWLERALTRRSVQADFFEYESGEGFLAAAKAQRFTGTWQFKFLSKVRNGVETIPSTLRRKYNIDTMPVRGRIRMKHLFGFKIGALNFRKLLKYLGSLEKCALNPEIA